MTKIAYLFPGQGSQAVGMGLELTGKYKSAADVFARADAIMPDAWGADVASGGSLSKLCFAGPEGDLTQTVYTQPALYTTSVATLMALREAGAPAPEAVAGHSVGEYAALFAADVFDFETGLRLVTRRAQEMQRTAEQTSGTMAAVLGLDPDAVSDICKAVGEQGGGIVDPANFNAPGQVVISGETDAVAAASALAKERAAKKVMPLKVSGAFHSRLMAPAGQAMSGVLGSAELRTPTVPVLANLTAGYVTTPDEVRAGLVAQIDHPVRWQQTVERLLADGYDTFVEVGAGKILSGMLRRMAPDVKVLSTGTAELFDETVAALKS